MAIKNDDRVLVAAVRQFAAENGCTVKGISHDWLLLLGTPDGRHLPLFGYDIGLNSATTLRIANDKAATADLLRTLDVAHIPHQLFLNPDLHVYTRGGGNWSTLADAFEAAGQDVVLKSNEGTSGKDVHRVQTHLALERTAHVLFRTERSIALSPFTAIAQESRFVVLDGVVKLGYAKRAPSLQGDGRTSLRQILAQAMTPEMGPSLGAWLEGADSADLDTVPPEGASLPIGWRHNLGQGGGIVAIANDAPGADLALAAAAALNLRFGSVDIAHPAKGGDQVMEVNAGVMLEHYARSAPDRRAAVIATYADALALLLASAS
ncbi:MAG: hypothetical protein P1U65_08380 [Minwuia sp.]|nr:hypothetical protein [Minwuia sp.]